MNQDEQYQKFEAELQTLADKYSITRIKVSTINFDRDYRSGAAGNLHLVSTKAVIRSLGHTAKVPIGEGEEFSTYEEAEEATKKKWSEYYKSIRANRSDAQKLQEAKRQKRYRERRKKTDISLKRQQ